MVILLLSLILLISCGVLYLLYQIVKQQGRLLFRLDTIEERLGLDSERSAQTQLEVGKPFASFKLRDLTGKEIALDDFRGNRVFVVNWNPQCGFCELIAPDLAKLQERFKKCSVQLLLIAGGDGKTNRKLAEEHGLYCPILLHHRSDGLETFAGLGTPVACFLDRTGRIAKPVAVGSEEVPALASEIVTEESSEPPPPGNNPLIPSRLERNGLKAGTPAPLFRLPDILGHEISLEKYRGRRVLLVFSDPHCGPCDQLAPHLVRLHHRHRNNNLGLIMISRGEVEENRRKAAQHAISFPVVLQRKWEISKDYGIFAMPVAFLIGEDGAIAKSVARGVEEIVQLVESAVN